MAKGGVEGSILCDHTPSSSPCTSSDRQSRVVEPPDVPPVMPRDPEPPAVPRLEPPSLAPRPRGVSARACFALCEVRRAASAALASAGASATSAAKAGLAGSAAKARLACSARHFVAVSIHSRCSASMRVPPASEPTPHLPRASEPYHVSPG